MSRLLLLGLTLAASLAVSACTTETGQNTPSPAPAATSPAPGSTEMTAVKAASIAFEYQWIAANRPGWKPVSQALIIGKSGKPYDLITIGKNGQTEAVYFDISSFFGQGV